uniref:Uncharacterized protein n=1 Tax=Rhizophora mucronata TaxID=61149 RepID=A0A2P2NCY2_RHIMU
MPISYVLLSAKYFELEIHFSYHMPVFGRI